MPAPEDGVIGEIHVKVGDKVSQGSLLATYASVERRGRRRPRRRPTPSPPPAAARSHADFEADLLVLGAGPGGYTAAFRAADLGQKVRAGRQARDARRRLPQRRLHPLEGAAACRQDHRRGGGDGGARGQLRPRRRSISTPIGAWKDGVVKRLTTGLTGLARQRKVTVVSGRGRVHLGQYPARRDGRRARAPCASPRRSSRRAPSRSRPGFIPSDPRIWDSTAALELRFVPKRMLILGGGIIGLEMATVYRALGAEITVIEMMDQLMPGADPDIVAPLAKRLGKLYDKILLKTKVTAVKARARRTARHRTRARTARRPRSSTPCWSRSAAGRTAS